MFKFMAKCVWRLFRWSLVFAGAGLLSSWLFLGNDMVQKVGAVGGRVTRNISDTLSSFRLRALSNGVEESKEALHELVSCRDSISQQTDVLKAKRAEVLDRIRREQGTLKRILTVLHGAVEPAPGSVSLTEAETDATDVIQRIKADREEVQKYDLVLAQVGEAREVLERKIPSVQHSLDKTAESLVREQAGLMGRKAYETALQRASEIEAVGTGWSNR